MTIKSELEQLLARDPAPRELGFTIESADRHRVVIAMTVSAAMLNAHGLCHGGYLTVLADTALAYACNQGRSPAVTTSVMVDFIGPARLGDALRAQAHNLDGDSRAGVCDVAIFCDDGSLVARARGRYLRVRLEGTLVRTLDRHA